MATIAPDRLPRGVHVGPGRGGLDAVHVVAPSATATLYLQGAHLTDWTPAGESPVLWTSTASGYREGTPIRGGVPICFPWFDAHPAAPAAPAHGFARRVPWELTEATETGEGVELVLTLTDDESTRSGPWPHRFEARLTVRVGRTLGLELRVTNRDTVDLTFEEALHTYLRVGDVATCEVEGLEGAPFVDKADGGAEVGGVPGPVRFAGQVDRIYPDNAAGTVLRDGATRSVRVDKRGSSSTIVWNPGEQVAARMADVGEGEWRQMVCVETANVRDAAVSLAPGEVHAMTVTYGVVR